MNVTCPYCQQPAQLVSGLIIYPHRLDLGRLKFWLCKPCKAYVGCHKNGDGTKPLGRLANAELRAAKSAAHLAFDPIWKTKIMIRTEAYYWLAKQLGIKPTQCHIGEFDIEQCKKVIMECNAFMGLLEEYF